MANSYSPFYPIIYVRGFAMSRREIDITTADPFCGFNSGSTVYRATSNKKTKPRKLVFESPLVRLATDFGYRDVYEEGRDIMDKEWSANPDNKLAPRSIIIFRYYDEASDLLGDGKTPPISDFAIRLGKLITRVRELYRKNPDIKVPAKDFRCYLVAHSMGGLVCRAFLQNPKYDPGNARQYVDKFYTYATPHNGIDVAGVNVPSWLTFDDVSNFNRDYMAEYLAIPKSVYKGKGARVDWLPESRFPSDRVFCMVGTNRMDYEAAFGASRTFVGHGSDGLVRIENATLTGLRASGRPGAPCPKAFTYRSHSGFFGIVNGEESYQNLVRFLFGNVRADLWIDIEGLRLPVAVQQQETEGKTIGALYQIEVKAAPKGKPWFLTRRTAEEDSAACVTHAEWVAAKRKCVAKYVSTVFLAKGARVDRTSEVLSYQVALAIRTPDYEVDHALWLNDHYEGGTLFSDTVEIHLTRPPAPGGKWTVAATWQHKGVPEPTDGIDTKALKGGNVEVRMPFDSATTPGVKGAMRFVVSQWNADAAGEW